MNDKQNNLERQLSELGSRFSAIESIQDVVVAKVADHRMRASPRRTIRYGLPLIFAAMASLAWLVFGPNQQTVYAQALAAMRKAQTIHIVGEGAVPGYVPFEIWYDAEHGYREERGNDGDRVARIDDGQFLWLYSSRLNEITKSQSIGAFESVTEFLDQASLTGESIRGPEGDQEIDGETCRLFVLGNDQSRRRAWLDQTDRLRLLEVEQRHGGGDWQVLATLRIEYDQPIARALFEPQFAADVRLIDLEGAAAVQPESLPMSRQQLMQGAYAARQRIRSICVIFNVTASKAASADLVRRREYVVISQGERVYIDNGLRKEVTGTEPLIRRVTAFNAERSSLYQANDRVATVRTGQDRETELRGLEYFDMMLLCPRRPDGAADDQNLISLLTSPHATIRPVLEEVNGRECHVVDLESSQQQGRVLMTVWLDHERGFLPLKYIVYGANNIEFEVLDAKEIEPGLWFAMRGVKRAAGSEFQITVYMLDPPGIIVNRNYDPSIFDLWKHVPVGTEVWDIDSDMTWIQGITDPRPAK